MSDVNTKVEADIERVLSSNSKDKIWLSENWNQAVQWYTNESNRQTDRPLEANGE